MSLHPAATAFLLAWAVGPAGADELVRTPVPNARPLMLAALQSGSGSAHGVLSGEIADAITRRFEASSPIYIDVATEKRFRQPGCSRLKVLFWQEGVRLPAAQAPRQQHIEFGINYCLDGLPPKSLR
ncbi:MAG: hypothetical protein LBE81_09330 [Azonexus sp.]|jgi:hypothetical protein|uniref:hypothetical protein n=1 Tax=Azonexus sp. TaxID=1872668 RepID=UPI0028247786|nr:hypothetical protein [Azonexus sp.]MDR0776823.1 hypothetical protein [Azonexus sp.]